MDTLQRSIRGSASNGPPSLINTEVLDPAAFDDLDDEGPSNDSIDDSESTQTAAAPAADLPQLPEDRQIALPSNSGLGDPGYCEIELGLRVTQADKSLQALRDAIADKSFQYSHVIRVAP